MLCTVLLHITAGSFVCITLKSLMMTIAEFYTVSHKVPTFELSLTLSNINQFSKFLHCLWNLLQNPYDIYSSANILKIGNDLTKQSHREFKGGNFFKHSVVDDGLRRLDHRAKFFIFLLTGLTTPGVDNTPSRGKLNGVHIWYVSGVSKTHRLTYGQFVTNLSWLVHCVQH